MENPPQELFNLIERTYNVVLNSSTDDKKEMNCYGYDYDNHWFSSDTIVFGIRYDEFLTTLGDDIEWLKNNCNQKKFLNSLIESMQKEFSQVLSSKVGFIVYDDFNTQKKTK